MINRKIKFILRNFIQSCRYNMPIFVVKKRKKNYSVAADKNAVKHSKMLQGVNKIHENL